MRNYGSNLDLDDNDQTFQVSVSLGGEKKQINAHLYAQPADIALRFVNEHGIDKKYIGQLT